MVNESKLIHDRLDGLERVLEGYSDGSKMTRGMGLEGIYQAVFWRPPLARLTESLCVSNGGPDLH